MNTVLRRSFAILSLCGVGLSAHATVLTFSDLGLISGNEIPGSYGDFVTGPGGSPGGSYGMGTGWTPNVEVAYATATGEGTVSQAFLTFWESGYGDLEGNAYPASSGFFGRMTFTPNAGFFVTLESFNMAAWGGSDLTPDRVRVLDSGGGVLWDGSSTTAPASGHATLTPNVTSDAAITLEWGSNWNLGVDDIAFSESVVPEPSAVLAISLGLAALGRKRRRSIR